MPFDPQDPFAPPQLEEIDMSPWGWVPQPWQNSIDAASMAAPMAAPVDVSQPAPQPAEIEMPSMDVGQVPDVPLEHLGFPTNPDIPQPPIEAEQLDLGPPVPDAISGADPAALGPLPPKPALSSLPAADLERPEDIDQTNARAFARLSPKAQADQEYDLIQRRDAEERRLQSEAAVADAEKQEGIERAYRTSKVEARRAREQLEVEAKSLAETNIDPEKWWNDRSTGQKIAGFLAAIGGGLVQHLNGGRNTGLAMIDQAIDRDIDAQKANMANKRAELQRRGGVVRDMAADAEGDLQDETRFRIAAYERVKTQISTDMQNFDPRGSARVNLGKLYGEIDQRQAAGLQAAEDRAQKTFFETVKLEQEQQKIDNEKAKNDAAAALAAAKASGAGAGKQKFTPTELAARNPTVPTNLIPTVDMTEKEFSAHLDRANKGGQAQKSVREGSTDERARTFGVSGLVNEDGSPWLARDTDVAKALTKKKVTAGRINDIINKALAIREEFGGETSWGNSDARQRLDVLQDQLVILAKGGTEGMSSDEDMKKLSKALGASNLASFRDQAAGLEEGRDNTTAALNAELIGNDYTGPLVKFPNIYAGGKRKRSEAEETFKKDLTWQTNQGLYGKTPDIAKSQGSAFPDQDTRGYSGEQERKARALAASMDSDPAARTKLELISTKADSPGYRALAKELLAADAPAPVVAPRFK